MHELEGKVSLQQQELSGLSEKLEKCEKENSGLVKKLAQYRGKLDSQEQSLALTRDEREELLQVKVRVVNVCGYSYFLLFHILYIKVFKGCFNRGVPGQVV
jgi:uncharacterized coiled-coil protein SlyX